MAGIPAQMTLSATLIRVPPVIYFFMVTVPLYNALCIPLVICHLTECLDYTHVL